MTFTADKGIESLTFSFFQLEDYNRLGVVDFNRLDVMEYTGVDLNSATNVRAYIDSLMKNYQAYAEYISKNMGLKNFEAQAS